jgi:ketosteroid isomerase-like protein
VAKRTPFETRLLKVRGFVSHRRRFGAVEERGDPVTGAGIAYCNTYRFVFRLEAGKLKGVTEYQDTEPATRVLGDPAE